MSSLCFSDVCKSDLTGTIPAFFNTLTGLRAVSILLRYTLVFFYSHFFSHRYFYETRVDGTLPLVNNSLRLNELYSSSPSLHLSLPFTFDPYPLPLCLTLTLYPNFSPLILCHSDLLGLSEQRTSTAPSLQNGTHSKSSMPCTSLT